MHGTPVARQGPVIGLSGRERPQGVLLEAGGGW